MGQTESHAGDGGLVTGSDIAKELRQRRKAFIEMSVPLDQEANYTEQGWESVRRGKKTARIRKPKPLDQQLEDDVWSLLARMGFNHMNSDRNFAIPVSELHANVPPKQIDVLAVDDETALVVECKASEQLKSRSLQKDLNETRALQQPIRHWINSQFDDRRRVCFVYATRNIRWSAPDRERAKNHQIAIIHDWRVEYYRKLVEIIGPAARHQLQADLLEGSPIQGLRATVPALRGTFGSKRFYQFAIEPERLLKLAYVSHRTKIDGEAIGTYQRLLKKKRLKDIAKHINDTGGVFPTSIVVNFRKDKRLRFDPSGASDDAPTVLGTLHLPNAYKSAWVIDGQHRLYGFSLSDWASKGKVPVLAFEGLDPSEEVSLFVDINNKQVRVPRALLVQLEPELSLGQDQPEQNLSALHSQLASDLSQSDDSPLFGRVASEWETDNVNKPVTLPQLVASIAGSRLVGSIRGGLLHQGYLYDRDSQTTRQRARVTIEKYLTLFSEDAAEHWERDPGAGGFLCTNLGISSLLRVFQTVLEHVEHTNEDIALHKLSPDAIVGSVSQFVSPIVDWFNTKYDSNRSRFRGRFGGGAPRIYALEMMGVIHDRFPSFDPPGLAKHRQEGSAGTISQAQQLITEIEDTVRELTFALLKEKFGADESDWWRKGVPQTVRSNAASRAETNEEGGSPHQFLDLIDYKKIAEQSMVWRDFEPHWTVDKSQRSKQSRLAWMDRLNTIRNRLSHSGRRHVTNDEIEFLERIWAHVGDEWARWSNRTP